MTIECPKCQTENTEDSQFCKKCAAPLPGIKEAVHTKTLETRTEGLKRGSVFAGRYEIIEELGKGGMGKVYRVEDTKIKKEIALKLIKPEIASDKKTIERFKNELTTARDIRHKNVCGMFDLGEEKGQHFITMEYVSGGDLKRFIRRVGQLPIGRAISIAKQICSGLEEAHNLGIVHRDLKPNNIMVDDNGNARIMDFGIARTLKEKGITGAGVMIGTPEYMSPEQVEAKDVDQRSDIYSLGIIIYEMLTGRLPFEADTPFAVGVKHKSEAPKNPKDLNPQISENLSGLILKCLEKKRINRYQSAQEVYNKLAQFEEGITRTEIREKKKEPKTVKIGEIQLKKIILYSVVSFLVIALVLAGIFLLPRRQKVVDSIAILPFKNVSDDPELDYLSDGITESIIDKLALLPSMKRVIARSSVFRYKGKEINPKDIGLELGVEAVLISQIYLRDDELSIAVELVNTSDNSRIWGNQYKKNMSDIFGIQEDITESIMDNLRLKLTGQDEQLLNKHPTEDTEAYKLYLRGRFFWNKRTGEDLKIAIENFEKAIEIDQNLAQAYAGLADSHSLLTNYGPLPPAETYPRAKEAALKAISIDDTLAEGYTSLAFIKFLFEWDWTGAEENFTNAIKLNKGYVDAYHWYGSLLSSLGRHEEALRYINTALEQDPFSLLINRALGRTYLRARQYDQAIETIKKTIEMDPDYQGVRMDLGKAYLYKSMYEEALKEFQKANNQFYIAITNLKLGKSNQVEELIKQRIEQSKKNYTLKALIAILYFALGENDKGFEWLTRAYDEREPIFRQLKHEQGFDSVRSDPRFIALLKKMNLE